MIISHLVMHPNTCQPHADFCPNTSNAEKTEIVKGYAATSSELAAWG